MTQAKHTPGPLHVFSVYAQHEVRTQTDSTVAVCFNRADAKLFASAHELLDALKVCLSTLTDERIGTWQYMEGSQIYQDMQNAASIASAAIAKATGSTP